MRGYEVWILGTASPPFLNLFKSQENSLDLHSIDSIEVFSFRLYRQFSADPIQSTSTVWSTVWSGIHPLGILGVI